jgi:acyl dehydratase
VCKAVVDAVLGGDPTRVARYSVRFAGVAFPGETLRTSYWRENGKVFVDVQSVERGAPIISNAAVVLKEPV